jgi:hypothetical protein
MKYHVIKTYTKKEVRFHVYLASMLDGGELSVPRPGRFKPWGKSPSYPFDKRLCGPQSQSGCGDEEEESQPLPEIEPRSSSP